MNLQSLVLRRSLATLIISLFSAGMVSAANVRITALEGTLFDGQGALVKVGHEIKSGEVLKTAEGRSARVVIGMAGSVNTVIRLGADTEMTVVKIGPSADPGYPILETELLFKNDRVGPSGKRVF